MCREDDRRSFRDLVDRVDEDRSKALELADDVRVVDDLLADVDRLPVVAKRPLDRVDGPLDPGAIAPRRRQKNAANQTATRIAPPHEPRVKGRSPLSAATDQRGRGPTRPGYQARATARAPTKRKAQRSGAVGVEIRARDMRKPAARGGRRGGLSQVAHRVCGRKRPPRFASPSGWDANPVAPHSQWAVRPIF